MPFGKKPVGKDLVDFDEIYERVYKKAAKDAGLEPERADTEGANGSIRMEMIERLFNADVVLADVTLLNANVYYELGVRHALAKFGTAVVRVTGGTLGLPRSRFGKKTIQPVGPAFDIQDVTILDLAPTPETLSECIEKLAERLRSAQAQSRPDSPVFAFIKGLRVERGAGPAPLDHGRTYELAAAPGRFVGYRSGDIANFKEHRAIDYWVNSENTQMEMARFSEGAVSATIRRCGAMDPDPRSPGFDDTIYRLLREARGNRLVVDPGEVLITAPGRLAETHGVKALLHAATVYGIPGRGFKAFDDDVLCNCLQTVLEKAREMAQGADLARQGRSIIVPMFGTGQARQEPTQIAGLLINRLVEVLGGFGATVPDAPDLREAYLLAFTDAQVDLLKRLFGVLEDKGVLKPATGPKAAQSN
jgi:hypothetical protein